jgi:hypothetical protein
LIAAIDAAMTQWREEWKQSLRYLAAARFYLPMTLKGGDKFAVEEALFWRELELAAQHMGLTSVVLAKNGYSIRYGLRWSATAVR